MNMLSEEIFMILEEKLEIILQMDNNMILFYILNIQTLELL
jgi:hypothetical protein